MVSDGLSRSSLSFLFSLFQFPEVRRFQGVLCFLSSHDTYCRLPFLLIEETAIDPVFCRTFRMVGWRSMSLVISYFCSRVNIRPGSGEPLSMG